MTHGRGGEKNTNCKGEWESNQQYTDILLPTIIDYHSPDIYYCNVVECTVDWERDISEVLSKVNSNRTKSRLQKLL